MARRWGRMMRALLLLVLLSRMSDGVAASAFPSSIYPPPAATPRWGNGGGCASRAGVSRPGRGATNAAFATLARFGRASLPTDLHLSDRALWPVVRSRWRHHQYRRRGHLQWIDVVETGPATRSPYASLVGHICGRALVTRSLWFMVCADAGVCDPAHFEHYVLLERHRHWLVWFQYP